MTHNRYKDKQYKEARNNYEQFLLLESRKSMTSLKNSSQIEMEDKTNITNNTEIPNKLRAFIGLAKVHSKEKNYKQAESILKGVLLDEGEDSVSKSSDVIRKILVKLYEKQGKLYESETVYKRLYEGRSHTYNTLEKQAEKLMQVENLEEAQVLFKQADQYKVREIQILAYFCFAARTRRHIRSRIFILL